MPDAYLRERAADVRDVGRRILAALATNEGTSALEIPEGSILVADELLPSATARFELSQVKALVTERGGKFSHTSILARSMRIPALTGIQEARSKIQTGDKLIVDGMSGILFINPDKPVRREYERLETELSGYRAGQQKRRPVRKIGATISQTLRVSQRDADKGARETKKRQRHPGKCEQRENHRDRQQPGG